MEEGKATMYAVTPSVTTLFGGESVSTEYVPADRLFILLVVSNVDHKYVVEIG